nr:DNA (cytosine-5)-methyltransferase [Ipomoea batatas]
MYLYETCMKIHVRKRQRKPSVKVSEAAAASSNGSPETSRRRGRKSARVESSEEDKGKETVPSTAASESTVVEQGEDANSRRWAVTTTRLVARIWGEYFSTESSKKVDNEKWMPYYQCPRKSTGSTSRNEVSWIGRTTRVTSDGNNVLYCGVSINGVSVFPGSVVLVNQPREGRDSTICFVEYMIQSSDGTKIVHGRVMVGAFETVLGNNAHKRELCLTEDCLNFYPSNVTKWLDVKIQPKPWPRKEPEEGRETEYFCRNLYCPDKGGFFNLKTDSIGLGNGHCCSCKARKSEKEKNTFSYCESTTSFTYQGIHYKALDFLYIPPSHFEESNNGNKSVIEDEDDSMPKAYVICQLVSVDTPSSPAQLNPEDLLEGCLELKETSRKIEEEKEDEPGSKCVVPRSPLATLDIFSGCGGLSEGLEKSGAAVTKWAIEYDQKASEAFKLNHPHAFTVVQNCNVVLRDVMMANGDAHDCIPSTEASSSASKVDDDVLSRLPKPGDGFSVLNRYKKNSLSDAKRTMILAFLSYVDYFRPKYVLVENVRNLVSFDNMQPFQLTLNSFLEMGYQVRFGVLEAGVYGVAQSRKRVFIWAAAPEETLPEWPEPMHAFPTQNLRIKLDLGANSHYTAVPSTRAGAPLRALTVRDTIGDLPALIDGDNIGTMPYKSDPISWFQKRVRGNHQNILTDHITKKLTETNLIQCLYLSAGQDWRDLPDKKIELPSTGEFVDLKPKWLVKLRDKGYQSNGVLGRLHWEKKFPTAITNPQPAGKVGRWFHPVEHRIISAREYARSQGFPDWYKFVGPLKNMYQQIGNAVPPPLAFALGRMLKVAMQGNNS